MRRIAIFSALACAALFLSVLAGTAAARGPEPFAEGCPTRAPEEGATAKLNHNPAARRAIVPAGAISMRICRYYGFGELGKQTAKTQARVGKLQDQAVVSSRDLLESVTLEFKELEAAPKGAVSCPSDESAQLYAIFSYRVAQPVILRVNLSGCRFVSGAAPRARQMTELLQNRLLRLAEGRHAEAKPGHSVKDHGAVAYPPPRLTFPRARNTAESDLEVFCKESKLCRSWSIGRCSRKSAKAIGCRYLAELLSGEECRGAIRVTSIGEGMLSSTPGVQDSDEGECFYLFAPPGFKEEMEERDDERRPLAARAGPEVETELGLRLRAKGFTGVTRDAGLRR